MVYRFRVGQIDLNFAKYVKQNKPIICAETEQEVGYYLGTYLIDKSQAKHVCFLLNKDLFEYSSHGWSRRRNVGRDPEYDWDSLGDNLNGTTMVSPDQLEKKIINDGNWTGYEYNFLKHNCRFC